MDLPDQMKVQMQIWHIKNPRYTLIHLAKTSTYILHLCFKHSHMCFIYSSHYSHMLHVFLILFKYVLNIPFYIIHICVTHILYLVHICTNQSLYYPHTYIQHIVFKHSHAHYTYALTIHKLHIFLSFYHIVSPLPGLCQIYYYIATYSSFHIALQQYFPMFVNLVTHIYCQICRHIYVDVAYCKPTFSLPFCLAYKGFCLAYPFYKHSAIILKINIGYFSTFQQS